MSKNTTTKTLYYLRARRDGTLFDLQSITQKARAKKSTCAASEITLGGGDVVRIQHYSDTGGYIRLHLSRYVPGVQASTLQPKTMTPEDDEGTQAPPNGKEFKDGDSFLLIKDHHVLYCGHGMSKSKAIVYLGQLFKAADLHEQSVGFELVPASNLDKLRLIQDHGVKSIQLAVGAFGLGLPKARRTGWIAKSLGTIGDELSALISKDQSAVQQKALEDLIVNVEVKLDGNTRALQSSQDFIEELAQTVLDDKELPVSEFTIVTQKNERITSGEIRLQTGVKVETKDNSVSYASVWNEMATYFGEMAQGNLMEQ